jgi:predicted nucleic acid-binding protein
MEDFKAYLQNEAVQRLPTWAVKEFLRTIITGGKPVGMTEEVWGMLLSLYVNFTSASPQEIRAVAEVCESHSNTYHNPIVGGTALGLYLEAERREVRH